MDLLYKLYLKRAQNELNLSSIILKLSDDSNLQIALFKLPADTYYSAVISHAYYSIFYAAKAYLLTKNIKTEAPEEHRNTFEAFKTLVEEGVVDVDLLKLYEQILLRANALLHIFELEKKKRGKFTYKTLPQANEEPAQESFKNAELFFKHICALCETE